MDLAAVAALAVMAQVAMVLVYAAIFKVNPAPTSDSQVFLARVNHITIYLAYFTLGHWYWGKTLGKKVCGLQLFHNGQELSFLRSLSRSISYIASGQLTFGIGFSLALFRSDQKALHDLFCTTKVEFVKVAHEQAQKAPEDLTKAA